ncbi:hypothetical protein THAOC_33301 [Thalassiosira oceanica]|uniref:DUF7495 domain-containing protein n=1 Tax=Thalassiosira oceanica TaxID=159749 RepID=K0R5C7_THAOC|nr:hypothetical protein THAOC_33301 [Thalassiosira oceanica]|eukprot:EJK47940.1 hypothetical protein THAOC_33301 [Thalassiosira oceanica]
MATSSNLIKVRQSRLVVVAFILGSLATAALNFVTFHLYYKHDVLQNALKKVDHLETTMTMSRRPHHGMRSEVTYSVKGTPTIYDKSDGLEVGSSREGEEFCKQMGKGKLGSQLCPYEAYCNGGRGVQLFKGIEDHLTKLNNTSLQAEAWAPLASGGGQPVWVGLGAKNLCHQRGQVDEDFVAPFIMCCHMDTVTMPDLTLDWFMPSGNAKNDREYDLLVLVLAGGAGSQSNERFEFQQDVWLKVSRESERLGLSVKIYLLTMDSDIQEATTDGVTIKIPGENSYIPGCMVMTMKAIEYIHETKLQGHRHKYLLRTNISSLWCFPKYLSYIGEKFPTGSTQVYNGMIGTNSKNGCRQFISGSGILLSPDLERLMVNDQERIMWDIVDDTAIGTLLIDRHNVTATWGRRQDFTSLKALGDINGSYWDIGEDQYHFRVKSRSHGSTRDNVLQDKLVMSHLFFHCYSDRKNQQVKLANYNISLPTAHN